MDILKHPSLADRTTLRLGGTARAELRIEGDEDWDQAGRFLEREGDRAFVLGGGSNVLAADGALPQVLIRPRLPEAVELLVEDEQVVALRIGAGLRLPRLLGWAAGRGLSGLEPLAGIPGTVGGAAAMNAGSFGSEFGQAVSRLQIWRPEDGLRWYSRGELQFGYRRLVPGSGPGLFGINGIEVRLERRSPQTVRRGMRDFYLRKKASQPVLAWTCGCVFKNPAAGQSAGELLEACGFRGRRLGGVAFSDRHANFLVNLGQGTGREAFELVEAARQAVWERFGERLQLEVQTLRPQDELDSSA